MAAPKRTAPQIEKDREVAMSLYLKGRPQHEIADQLGVSQAQVCYDLKKVREEWRKRTALDLDEAKLIELEKINLLEREHWSAWTSLKKDVHLTGVATCIQMRVKLLHLDELPMVRPVAISSPDQGQLALGAPQETQDLLAKVSEQSATMLEAINERHRAVGLGHYRTRPVLQDNEDYLEEDVYDGQ